MTHVPVAVGVEVEVVAEKDSVVIVVMVVWVDVLESCHSMSHIQNASFKFMHLTMIKHYGLMVSPKALLLPNFFFVA